MENLPKNWIQASISEIAFTSSGGTPKTARKDYWDGNVPWINSGKLKDKRIDSPTRMITELGLKESSAKLFPIGTTVIALTGATTGRVGLLDIETSTNQSVTGIWPNEYYVSEFLFYQLRSLRGVILSKALGSAQPHINKKIVDDLAIKYPPLAEQQRIVAKLDDLFGHLEQVKTRLEKIPDLLKDFRQAILDKELINQYERNTIGELCNKVQDGAHHSPKNQYSENDGTKFLYITSKNIRNNYMKLDKIVYVDKEFHDTIYTRCTPELGDVLLTKDGANTGNVTLNTIHKPFSLLSSVCLIKTKKELLIPAYLKYYIQSPSGFKELIGEMTGTAIKRIILRKIKNATIPTPPIDEQIKIVQRIESLFAKADAIEAKYNALKSQIDSLPQAILAKAFKGELVEQLESDGSAKDLLKEIEKLKAESSKVKKKKKKSIKA